MLTISFPILVMLSAFDALPTGASKEGQKTSVLAALLPQGWNFFTRNPREERLNLYKRDSNGEWFEALEGPNFLPRFAFGWIRTPRAQRFEVEAVLRMISADQWHPCEKEPKTCLKSLANENRPQSIRNGSRHPRFCGDVAYTLQEPVPWMWTSAGYKTEMPSQIAMVNIVCGGT